MNPNNRILVVAAHPDDEALGCGGAIARHASRGEEVSIVFVADGVTSRDGASGEEKEELAHRREAARTAARILGAHEPSFFEFADQRLDQYPLIEITRAIEELAREFQPTVVYTHYHGDLNLDHRIVARATLTAFRPVPTQSVRHIYGFEVLSSTEWEAATDHAFRPHSFLDISERYLAKKFAALDAYEREMRPYPHARSFKSAEALARLRGASVGLEAAEAFVVYREVIC